MTSASSPAGQLVKKLTLKRLPSSARAAKGHAPAASCQLPLPGTSRKQALLLLLLLHALYSWTQEIYIGELTPAESAGGAVSVRSLVI